MLFFAEKDFISSLENEFNLNSDCENYHGHNKGDKDSFARVFTFIFLLNLGNRNKQLFHVVLVEGQRIKMSENAPIC